MTGIAPFYKAHCWCGFMKTQVHARVQVWCGMQFPSTDEDSNEILLAIVWAWAARMMRMGAWSDRGNLRI